MSKDKPETEAPVPGEMEGKNNIVLSTEFAGKLLEFLNTQPRGQVNKLCTGLEQCPILEDFNKQVVEFYAGEPKPK